jgi:hypothetical protein
MSKHRKQTMLNNLHMKVVALAVCLALGYSIVHPFVGK